MISASDRQTVEQALQKTSCPLSSFSFIPFFLWQHHFDFISEQIDGCLIIFAQNKIGRFMMLPPLGAEPSSACLDACFRRMETINNGSGVSRIENVPASWLRFFSTDKFDAYNKGYEYLYSRADLEQLSGNAYKSKRASLNQFCRNYSSEFLRFAPDMANECLALYDDWAEERRQKHHDDIYQHLLDENRDVHARVFAHHQELGLIGRVLLVDGKIRGYTFGYPQNEQVFCVLLEVVDLSLKGAAVYIFQRFCADPAAQPFPFINTMEDMMSPAMEKTKMSFRPVVLLPSFVITRKREGSGR